MNARGQWLTAAAIQVAFGCLAGIGAAQTAPAARQFELPPLENLQATRERPLFNPTRRPPAVTIEPGAPPPITESVSLPFELTGTALSDDIRIAILRNKTTNEELRLREGEHLDEWLLETIADRFILLRGEGRRVRVWLFDNAKRAGVDVRRLDGEEDSTAAVLPAAEVDQEVLPSAAPASRMPVPAPPASPILKRRPRPPSAARAAPQAPPEGRPPMRRN